MSWYPTHSACIHCALYTHVMANNIDSECTHRQCRQHHTNAVLAVHCDNHLVPQHCVSLIKSSSLNVLATQPHMGPLLIRTRCEVPAQRTVTRHNEVYPPSLAGRQQRRYVRERWIYGMSTKLSRLPEGGAVTRQLVCRHAQLA